LCWQEDGVFIPAARTRRRRFVLFADFPISHRPVPAKLRRKSSGRDARRLVNWGANAERADEIPPVVARVLPQDFTGACCAAFGGRCGWRFRAFGQRHEFNGAC